MRAVNGFKECSGCKQSLELSHFTTDKSMADGLDFYCRECRRARNASPKRREAARRYSKTERARSKSRRANRKHYKKNRDRLLDSAKKRDRQRVIAVSKVNTAIRDGKMIRSSVCSCADDTCYGAVEAHHPDYSKPYDVEWLCKSHHYRKHREE